MLSLSTLLHVAVSICITKPESPFFFLFFSFPFFSTDDNTPTPIVENSSKGKIYFDGRRRKRRSLTEKKELERSEEDEMYKQFVGQAEGHRNFLRNDARYESSFFFFFFLFFLFLPFFLFFFKERFLWSVVKFLVNSPRISQGVLNVIWCNLTGETDGKIGCLILAVMDGRRKSDLHLVIERLWNIEMRIWRIMLTIIVWGNRKENFQSRGIFNREWLWWKIRNNFFKLLQRYKVNS